MYKLISIRSGAMVWTNHSINCGFIIGVCVYMHNAYHNSLLESLL